MRRREGREREDEARGRGVQRRREMRGGNRNGRQTKQEKQRKDVQKQGKRDKRWGRDSETERQMRYRDRQVEEARGRSLETEESDERWKQ